MYYLHLITLLYFLSLPIIFWKRNLKSNNKQILLSIIFGIFSWFIWGISYNFYLESDYQILHNGFIAMVFKFLHSLYLYNLLTDGYVWSFVGLPLSVLFYILLNIAKKIIIRKNGVKNGVR